MGDGGRISAIYSWFENVYLCTDLNPDQYKQYLLRSSAVTKPLFKANNTQRITLNYEQMKKKKKKALKKENKNTV